MRPHLTALFLTLALTALTTHAAEPAKPAALFNPADALAGLPRDVVQDLRPGSRKLTDAAAKAAQVVAKNVEGKMATVKFDILSIEKFQRPDTLDIDRYRIKAETDKIRSAGATFEYLLMIIADPSENEKIAKLKKGDKVTFTGKIANGNINPANGLDLHIDIIDAKLN
ncbi:MAG TPA: hypothetical protein VD994_22105 [Prosthecobacter sp.]|nr:hypothetical protein [Prosthecobacter sp.]